LPPLRILQNDFQRQWRDLREDVLRIVDTVGASGWYILGQQVSSFESQLASWWGLPFAAGVASGLDALELALRAAGVVPGSFVLTTPLSAFATTMAIARLGATPVFCDTDACGLMDLEAAHHACRSIPEIRFVVPVHLYGFPLDPDALDRLCRQHGLLCIEDCAQSIGAERRGRPTGTIGVAAATSFYPTKNLGAMGDGGAVLTRDAAFASRIRLLRDYGQQAKYSHAELGYNSRLDELHAAMLGAVFLPRLEGWTGRRRQIADAYRTAWMRNDVRPLPWSADDANPCWHLFPISVPAEKKPALLAWLREHGIGAGEHYPCPIPDQPAMRSIPHRCHGDVSNARRLAASEISLPVHPYLEDQEVAEVLSVIERWAG
jgi:dTDP-3-amino-3,4,6-trideoxy-alpha-D-glucose transaminase